MVTPVRKAVIPAAGLGTRFLPVTKSQPKEMLPIVDKPAIQYVVEEAVQAGITDILIVTGRGKRAIEDHFDRNVELEAHLDATGKFDIGKEVAAISELAEIHYIRQRDPLGLGHAVSVARQHIGDEPFAVLLGDDVMVDNAQLLRAMLASHATTQRTVVALKEMPPAEISQYGCADVVFPERAIVDGDCVRVRSLVEKPAMENAPSNLAVLGRYILTPEVFDALDRTVPGRNGEIQLTDALALVASEHGLYGQVFTHGRYDVGNKLDYLRANIELALMRNDLRDPLRAYLAGLVADGTWGDADHSE
jgi:UTP--glucose-1-phosphate uridylyltransferase